MSVFLRARLTSTTPTPPPTEMKLRYTWSTDVVTMGPHTGWSTDALMIVRVCYERLVRLQGSTMNLEGELAEDWSVPADGLTYTFSLRENVTFDDGSPFNATAVKKSFERLLGIGQQSQNFLALKEISIVDQNTVKFTLNYAFAPFINALATMQASIININARAYYNNTMADQLLDNATREQDVNRRMDLYHQAAEILAEDAVAVFVWEETKPVALHATVFGFVPNPCRARECKKRNLDPTPFISIPCWKAN